VRPLVKKIMVIDDLANRKHSCDLLLDQNYNKNGSRYNGLVPENCIQLLGPEYALLRPQFREARENLKREKNKVKRVLVFMGGADPTNATGKVLKAIKMLNRPDIITDVVIGIANPHRERIRRLASQMPNVVCHINVDNMAELTASADLYIGAGGITTWERCCLGVPSIVIVIAENQRSATESLAEDGVVMNLGWDKGVREGAITDAIRQLIGNSQQR
jgi:UDP-2,4-diacetamido-2,4,6-trideoxy-beta-L-altropyranose hydrolase